MLSCAWHIKSVFLQKGRGLYNYDGIKVVVAEPGYQGTLFVTGEMIGRTDHEARQPCKRNVKHSKTIRQRK